MSPVFVANSHCSSRWNHFLAFFFSLYIHLKWFAKRNGSIDFKMIIQFVILLQFVSASKFNFDPCETPQNLVNTNENIIQSLVWALCVWFVWEWNRNLLRIIPARSNKCAVFHIHQPSETIMNACNSKTMNITTITESNQRIFSRRFSFASFLLLLLLQNSVSFTYYFLWLANTFQARTKNLFVCSHWNSRITRINSEWQLV